MMLTTSSKVNAAKKFAASGQYKEAAEIADRIALEKVSSIHELMAIANIYLHTKQYEDAKAVYVEMYSRAKTHRVMVGLIDLCLKIQEPKEAEHYIREFRKLEPENPERLIFRYRVDVMLGKSNEYLLKSLTKLKDEDYSDIWGLELAKIYFKENDMAACAKECRDILLWFPDSDLLPKVRILLNACEDVLEQEEDFSGEKQNVEVVEITSPEKTIPDGTYDRIIYDDDDDDDDDEDEYVIRDYFGADAPAVIGEAATAAESIVSDVAASVVKNVVSEAAVPAVENNVSEETTPAVEEVISEEVIPAEEVVSEKNALAEEDAISDEIASVVEEILAEDASSEENAPAVEETIAEETIENATTAAAEVENSIEAALDGLAKEPVISTPVDTIWEEAPVAKKETVNDTIWDEPAVEDVKEVVQDTIWDESEENVEEELVTEEEPVVAEEPMVEEEFEAEEEPVVDEESEAEEEPATEAESVVEEPVATEEPVIEEEPVAPVVTPVAYNDMDDEFGYDDEVDILPEDLGNLRTEELVYDMDSALWEVPDDGMLPANGGNSWMKGMDVSTMPSQPDEEDLTDAAINAVFQEDDDAIEQALYDLLKK